MELLVRVKDKINADPFLNDLCTKRGDVIVAMPDGHAWSERERTNPDWVIVKCDISLAQANAMLTPTTIGELHGEKKIVRKREFQLNLDGIVNDRTSEHITLNKNQITALTNRKNAWTSPNVIGTSDNIIG